MTIIIIITIIMMIIIVMIIIIVIVAHGRHGGCATGTAPGAWFSHFTSVRLVVTYGTAN